MGIRHGGVFSYINTSRWMKIFQLETTPECLTLLPGSLSKYTAFILDLTLCVHTICLQHNDHTQSLSDALDLIVDKVRQTIASKCRRTKIIVLCIDSFVSGLKFAVSKQRQVQKNNQRNKWEDSPFVAALQNPETRLKMYELIFNNLRDQPISDIAIVAVQKYIPGQARIDGVEYASNFMLFHSDYHSKRIEDEKYLRFISLLRSGLCDLGDNVALESDMLCFQMAEIMCRCLGPDYPHPIVIESKDTDIIPIALARASRFRCNVHIMFRSIRRFLENDMDVNLYNAMNWLELDRPPVVVEGEWVNNEGLSDLMLTALDILPEHVTLHPIVQSMDRVGVLCTFVSESSTIRFIEACIKQGIRGPIMRRLLFWLQGKPLKELCTVVNGLIESDCILKEVLFNIFKIDYVKLLEDNDDTCSTVKGKSIVKTSPTACQVFHFVSNCYKQRTLPRGTYGRHLSWIEKMERDGGINVIVNPEASSLDLLTSATALSLYGTDYTNGIPSVGEKQLHMILTHRGLFYELQRYVFLRDSQKRVNSFSKVHFKNDDPADNSAALCQSLLSVNLWLDDSLYQMLKCKEKDPCVHKAYGLQLSAEGGVEILNTRHWYRVENPKVPFKLSQYNAESGSLNDISADTLNLLCEALKSGDRIRVASIPNTSDHLLRPLTPPRRKPPIKRSRVAKCTSLPKKPHL